MCVWQVMKEKGHVSFLPAAGVTGWAATGVQRIDAVDEVGGVFNSHESQPKADWASTALWERRKLQATPQEWGPRTGPLWPPFWAFFPRALEGKGVEVELP